MAKTKTSSQSAPRLHNDVYPFIYPAKFRGSLKDKVTIITGSAGTIGQALTECFAVAGATLVLVFNRTEPPAALTEKCVALGATGVHLQRCDVSDLGSCRKLVEQVQKVDVLINNAGANGLAPMHAQEPEDFVHDMAVNLHGPYFLMRLLIPTFREQRSGCVLNIASRAGTLVIPYMTSYCASKAALINLTGCVQKEFDAEGFDDVHLYSIHPGGIKSLMTLKSKRIPLSSVHQQAPHCHPHSTTEYHQDSVSALPAVAQARFTTVLDGYNDSPYLNGMACVALATGVAKQALCGRYFDVAQDLEDVIAPGQTAVLRADPRLHALHISYLGGSTDLTVPEGARDAPFEFPGF